MGLGSYSERVASSNPFGLILSTQAKVAGFSEVWPSTKKNSVVRVLPSFDLMTREIRSYRAGSGPGNFTDWITAFTVFSGGIGENTNGKNAFVSFICELPKGNGDCWTINEKTPPAIAFYNELLAGSKSDHPEWEKFFKGGRGVAAPISKPGLCAFIQCCVLEHNDKNYRQKPLVRKVMILRATARRSLEELCNKEVEPYHGDPEAGERYIAHNWLDPEQGCELIVTSALKEDREGNKSIGYDCKFGNPCPIPAKFVTEYFMPWEQVINFLTPEQQIEKLATVFPPEMIKYAFRTNETLLPGSVRSNKIISTPSIPQVTASQQVKEVAQVSRPSTPQPQTTFRPTPVNTVNWGASETEQVESFIDDAEASQIGNTASIPVSNTSLDSDAVSRRTQDALANMRRAQSRVAGANQ